MGTTRAAAESPDLSQTMRAMLALMVAEREERLAPDEEPRRTEVILAGAGFSPAHIAEITGRHIEAVRTTLRRARERSTATPAARVRQRRPAATDKAGTL
jgi:DNA-directed RNA polymerase specialized sigma24 family protein